MNYNDILIERIRSLCERESLSYTKLAKYSNLNQSTIDNIVRGNTKNPGIITLHRIASGFRMTLSEFLDIKELNEYEFESKDDNE